MFFSSTSTLRWFRLWWTLGWCWVALVWYLSLTSSPLMPDFDFAYTDKVGHCIAYAWLMSWFGNVYHRAPARLSYAALLVLMGITIEFIQGMGPYRQYEVADMLANTAGVFLGFTATLGPLRWVLHWFETRLDGMRAQ